MSKHVAPLRIAEANARKYLALALDKDIHQQQDMVTAYGWLTTVLGTLLESLDGNRAAPKRTLAVDPLLREFVGELADRIREEGMPEAADRIVELTGHTLRIADEHIGSPVKAVAA